MSDLDDRIYGKVSSTRGLLENIASKIPGFGGYFERENRRTADRLLRGAVAERMEEQRQHISRLQRDLIERGEIGLIDDLERAALILRTFSDRLSQASYGYSGLFDKVRIDEAELARIYAYDAALLERVDEVAQAVDQAQAALGNEALPEAIRQVEMAARQAVAAYERREEVVFQVDQPGDSGA